MLNLLSAIPMNRHRAKLGAGHAEVYWRGVLEKRNHSLCYGRSKKWTFTTSVGQLAFAGVGGKKPNGESGCGAGHRRSIESPRRSQGCEPNQASGDEILHNCRVEKRPSRIPEGGDQDDVLIAFQKWLLFGPPAGWSSFLTHVKIESEI